VSSSSACTFVTTGITPPPGHCCRIGPSLPAILPSGGAPTNPRSREDPSAAAGARCRRGRGGSRPWSNGASRLVHEGQQGVNVHLVPFFLADDQFDPVLRSRRRVNPSQLLEG